jgi:hypothetical protein
VYFATILKNPFYVGLMRIVKTGQTFEGVHEPLVSTDLFQKAQDVLAGKRVDRSKTYVSTYSRIVRCGSCGYSLIAERQKGHVYYRCHTAFQESAYLPADVGTRRGTLALPFRLIAEREKPPTCRPYRGTCRTWEEKIKELQTHFQDNPSDENLKTS